ncbi:substrate-binding periplasmic protein [Alteromonas sp. CYL-A6]|uniref:substrate-binding periplasmic protein n=1 Tax=Alteromonas nitratireducens TaxID=3390813 RepID=UPI0034BA6D18
MGFRFLRLCVAMGGSLLLAGFTVSAPASTITLYTEIFPPYQLLSNDEVRGINTDFLQRACALAGIDCAIKVMAWKRAYSQALSEPQSGVFSTFRGDDREEKFLWVGPLINSKVRYVYALKSRNDIQATSLAGLNHLTIGVINSDIVANTLMEYGFKYQKNLYPLRMRSDDLKLFFSGKLDLLAGSPLSMPYRLAQHCYTMDDIRVVAEMPMEGKGNYLALNKAIAPDVHARLQDAVSRLRAQGEDITTMQPYLSPPLPAHCQTHL